MKKPIYKSKAMWAGGLLVLYALSEVYGSGSVSPDAVSKLLTGVGIVGIRDALD